MRTFLEQALGLFFLGILAWIWLGLSESSAALIVVSVLLFCLMLAGLGLLIYRGIRGYTTRLSYAWLLGFPLAFFLVKWVPGMKALWTQAISMALRFGLAYLLFVAAWVTLLSLIPAGKPRSSQPVTAPNP
jgi:hypothetical protein